MKQQKTLPSIQTAIAADELIDMEQAIALLKTTRPTFYRWLRAGKIKGMKAGRQWRFYRADVDRFIKGQQPRIELVADIHPLIDALATKLAAVGGKTNGVDAVEPVAKVVNLMIQLGVAMRASDFHLESQTDGRVSQLHLRYRVDGVLHTAVTADVRLLPAIIEQWKRLGHCNVNVKDVPQDGRIELDLDASRLDLRPWGKPDGPVLVAGGNSTQSRPVAVFATAPGNTAAASTGTEWNRLLHWSDWLRQDNHALCLSTRSD